MAASSHQRNAASSCDDAACLRPTMSTTAGTGGVRSRTVRSRTRTGGSSTATQTAPTTRRIPAPLLEEARPAGSISMKTRIQQRVHSILTVALCCAVVFLVVGLGLHTAGWGGAVASSLVAGGAVVEVACWFLYLSNYHEKSRARLASVLLPEDESDEPMPTESSSRRVPDDEDCGYENGAIFAKK
ncbi:hypothetical protein HPB50_026332 [Hyalomma asiaticum]|uniref:Uncharacterized protein n=1 Tax=Hyalomma asiaticum TaxID=266040 RepID=A0ACB7SZV6_HYAAI|nr:hypothetical protein HPB50_026332 [Hyalomma asiaticum]